jgi:hypothetical protein
MFFYRIPLQVVTTLLYSLAFIYGLLEALHWYPGIITDCPII